MLEESPKFKAFVKNTSIKRSEIEPIIRDVAKDFNKVTKDFLDVLMESKKMSHLPRITSIFHSYIKHLNREEAIKVISATPLTDAQRERLNSTLREKYGHSNFTVEYDTQPEILGGLQVYFGDSFLDCSLATRLNKLKGQVGAFSV